MSDSDEEVVRVEETMDIQEAQPLTDAGSPILLVEDRRGNGRSSRVPRSVRAGGSGGNARGDRLPAVDDGAAAAGASRVACSVRAGGAGGNARGDRLPAVDDGPAASGAVAADTRPKIEVYVDKAREFYQILEQFNPLKRNVSQLEKEYADAHDKCVALKAKLEEANKKVQKMEPAMHDMQNTMHHLSTEAGKD